MDKKKQYKRLSKKASMVFLIPIIFMIGCVKTTTDKEIKNYIQDIKRQSKQEIEALPAEIKKRSAKYVGVTKRSPFLSSDEYIKSQVASSNAINAPDINRTRELLETYDLEDLVMVGSIKKEDGSNWGLVADKTGRIYKIQQGGYVGRNYGKITNISEKTIEIKEAVNNGIGGWQSNTVIMKLKE